MQKNDIWVVLPVFNESKFLKQVLTKLSKKTKNILVIDDGSSDKSFDIAKKFTNQILKHQINLGKGAALKTGCDYAFKFLKAKAVIFFDGDDQHDSKHLTSFFAKFKAGYHIILGERKVNHQMPLLRIIFNRLASLLVMILFGAYIADIPSGFKAISKKVYKKLRWEASDYDVELELAARIAHNKLPFVTVPIETIYHDFSRGMTIIDAMRIFIKLINLKLTL